MSLKAEIKNAVGAHGKWKNKLKKAIDTGKIDAQVSSIKADDQCSFGTWLHGPAVTEEEKKSTYFEQVRELHNAFHEAASKCVQLALSGNKDGAKKMLEAKGNLPLHLLPSHHVCWPG